MLVTIRERLCGAVDRIPGRFYVATPFIHIADFPVFPGRSYLVLQDSRVDPSLRHNEALIGYRIFWSWRSIRTAWFRGLLAFLSYPAVGLAAMNYWKYFNDKKDAQAIRIAMDASGVLALFLATYRLSLRTTLANRKRLLTLWRHLDGKYPQAALVVRTYLEETEPDALTPEHD